MAEPPDRAARWRVIPVADPIGKVADALEARAASFVKEHRLPGAAVGVVAGEGLAWSAGIGFADVAARRPPEVSTLYRVASITKTFTGTAIMQLRDEGRLHLDDPAVEYLPELRAASSPFARIETVTIRRLLSHESGLVGEPAGTDWSIPAYEGVVERTLERVTEIGTRVPPNTQHKYSNLGYQLLGEVVARVSGMPYPAYVRERVLDPLGMAGSGFEPLSEHLLERRATGYAARFLSDELELASTPPLVWAEGGLWSSVEDLARWISFQLGEDAGPRAGAQVLAGSTLKEMHAPRYLSNEDWTEAWCVAWYAIRKDGVTWVQHSGGIHGFTTCACFDPPRKVGAIVLLNGVADADVLAMDLGKIARDALMAEAPTIEPPRELPEAYRSLLGLYVSEEEGVVLRLEWRDGRAMLMYADDPEVPSLQRTLAPTEDPDVFLVEPGAREAGEPATFRRTADGRVGSLHLAAETYFRLDRVR